MNLYKELFDFLEANNWLSLEDEENAKGVISSYIKVYKPELQQGQSLPIDSVSQQSELVADQDSLNFKLWKEKKGFEKVGVELYKWNGLMFKSEFVLEQYLEYKNKATCG